jgi:hypothetical protein
LAQILSGSAPNTWTGSKRSRLGWDRQKTDMYNYPGNIHVHSRYSDGSGEIGQIIAEASAAGLSYVIVCDHETLAGLPEETVDQGVVLLVGVELNCHYNHYLAFGLSELVRSDDENPQNLIDRVRESGGLGFIAHPFDRGSRYIEKGRAFPWKTWPVFNFHGMEIWNYSSHWRGLHPSLFRTLYWFFINRSGAMKGPPRRLLRLWDCYNAAGHKVVAIGSSDAHATIYQIGFLKLTIFTYRYIFSTINTYIVLEDELSRDLGTAKKQVMGALRSGRCYISYDKFHPGKEFSFYALSRNRTAQMGDELVYHDGIRLQVKAPGRHPRIRLICDGILCMEYDGPELEFPVAGPGIYRAEVYHRPRIGKLRPWIFSNPIYVKPAP